MAPGLCGALEWCWKLGSKTTESFYLEIANKAEFQFPGCVYVALVTSCSHNVYGVKRLSLSLHQGPDCTLRAMPDIADSPDSLSIAERPQPLAVEGLTAGITRGNCWREARQVRTVSSVMLVGLKTNLVFRPWKIDGEAGEDTGPEAHQLPEARVFVTLVFVTTNGQAADTRDYINWKQTLCCVLVWVCATMTVHSVQRVARDANYRLRSLLLLSGELMTRLSSTTRIYSGYVLLSGDSKTSSLPGDILTSKSESISWLSGDCKHISCLLNDSKDIHWVSGERSYPAFHWH